MLRPSGVVHAAELSTFLLEKARVTSQLPGERNFHILHQLAAAAAAAPAEVAEVYP